MHGGVDLLKPHTFGAVYGDATEIQLDLDS